MILLFSHVLTTKQKEDAEKWGITSFLILPAELQNIWSDISPDIENVATVLEDIKIFIKDNAVKGDVILIQGDFGATYHMIKYVKPMGLIPVYATTKRMVKEYAIDGKNIKKSIFEHRRFREYE